MKLDFFTVESKYIVYLQSFDKRVPHSSKLKSNRPFVGVILTVNNINYFAPLSSPKLKHLKMKNQKDFLKIDGGKLGAINFNNMIPIADGNYKKIIIQDIEDLQYKKLLENQLTWCNKNKELIIKKANILYKLITNSSKDNILKNRTCDFIKLEEASNNYNK